MPSPGSPQPVAVLRGHSAAVNTLDFGEGGHELASGSADGEVRVWDVATRRTTCSTVAHGGLSVLAVHLLGRQVCSQGRDGQIVRWDVSDGAWRETDSVAFTSYSFCRCALQQHLVAMPMEEGKVCDTGLGRGFCGSRNTAPHVLEIVPLLSGKKGWVRRQKKYVDLKSAFHFGPLSCISPQGAIFCPRKNFDIWAGGGAGCHWPRPQMAPSSPSGSVSHGLTWRSQTKNSAAI